MATMHLQEEIREVNQNFISLVKYKKLAQGLAED